MRLPVLASLLLALAAGPALGQDRAPEAAPPTTYFVAVEPQVQLEVLDWGGTGRPLVFLAGLPGTPRGLDAFARRFTAGYHVYGITRRGFGGSSRPYPAGETYSADRLGDDVLSVLRQLHLERPVLVGHSFAGEEMSSIGSRFPQRVAGLIYLDAAMRYAFSPAGRGDFHIDTLELKRKLDASLNALSPGETRAAIDDLLRVLPQYEQDLQTAKQDAAHMPDMTPAEYAEELAERSSPAGQIEHAILNGERRFTAISCPVLAIFAVPHDLGLPPGSARNAADKAELANYGRMADDFEAQVPTAHVVRIAHARHAVYESNEAQVVAEMNAFLATLP